MSSDREEMKAAMSMDWTTPEYLANLAAEELGHAMAMRGIDTIHCGADGDEVSVSFQSLDDASALLCLAIPGPTGPGTLYDHATSGCVTLSALADAAGDEGVPDDQVAAAIEAGWEWLIHPNMKSHVVGWHTSVTMSATDANTVTARLNALPFTDDTQ